MGTQDNGLYQNILNENIKLHRIEAPYYEKLHPEEFNWFEQAQTVAGLTFIKEQLPKTVIALDVGCGTGNILLKLLDMGISVRGVDISKDMLTVLEGRIPLKHRAAVDLSCVNIDDFLAGCSQSFDLITINSVLHHLPDYLKTLNTAIGLLNKGGWLYIRHEPTKISASPDRFLRKMLWQLDNLLFNICRLGRKPDIREKRDCRMSDYHVYHGFDEDKVAAVCRDAGLRVVKFQRYSSCMRLGLSCWIDSKLLHSESLFGLIAQKV